MTMTAAEIDSFTCPACGRTSWNQLEVRTGYCSACLDVTGTLGVTGELIMSRTASHFQLSVEQLTCPDRSRHLAGPRQIAMFLCRELTDLSLLKIGDLFHRDHTTVIHGVRKVKGLMHERPLVYRHVAAIADRVTAQADRYGTHTHEDGCAYVR